MLKAGDLARREDHRVRGVKGGEPDEIGGYHMYEMRSCVTKPLKSPLH